MKNAIYSQSQDQCVCKEGFEKRAGECYDLGADCGDKQVYDLSLQKCVCAPSYIEVKGKCVAIQ